MSIFAPMRIIGGQGGQWFQDYSANGQLVTKIGVWVGGSQIKAIQLWRTDESASQTFGRPMGPYKEFTFNPGERITKLSLWGNGAGTRLGWIYFETNQKRSFDFGMTDWGRKQEYPVDVGSGIFLGMQGYAGADIDAGGFVFFAPIRSAIIRNLSYPTLDFDTQGVSPKVLATFRRKNPSTSTHDEKWEFSDTKLAESTENWAITVGMEAYMEVSVEAGIPEVAKVGEKFGWKVSASSTYSTSAKQSETLSWKLSGAIAPGEEVSLQAICREGRLPGIPWTGQMQLTMISGETCSYPLKGTYAGVTYSSVEVVDGITALPLGVLRAASPPPPITSDAVDEVVPIPSS